MEFLKIWEILLRRKWVLVGTFLAFFSVVVIGTKIITRTYKAQAKLLVETSDSLTSLMSNLGLQDQLGMSLTSTESYETDIALATIRPLLEELISSLDLKSRSGEAISPSDLVDSSMLTKLLPQPYIRVGQYEDADMLAIESFSADPEEATNMSNKLAELYINDRLGKTREEYKSARIFIESQMQKVKEEYYDSLSDLKNFRIQEGTVDLSLETQNLINKIATLTNTYEENERMIFESEKEIAEIEKKLSNMDRFRTDWKEFKENDELRNLKAKLNDLLIKISEKSIFIKEEHPEYKQYEKQVETVKGLMKDQANVIFDTERFTVDPVYDELSKKLVGEYIEREVALSKSNILRKYIDEYQDELLEIPVKHVENSKLDLALSVNKEMFKNLLEYMTQVGVAESMTLSNIKLVELATVPEEPEFPKRNLSLALGLFLGLFWGLFAAFFMEYIDNTVKTPDDIKKHFKNLSLLGTVPKTKFHKGSNLISDLSPTSPIVEIYRTIRNSIRYASIDKPIKTLMTTSAVKSEGKSSFVSNVATTFSAEGKKTIIVDMDLRRPSIHRFFGISNDTGITNVITESLNLEDAIVQTDYDGLYVLPSGPIPPDPTKLIESKKIKEIIDRLTEMYDMVLIDTPPVMAVNDAMILGRMAEAVVMIIESGAVAFSILEHSAEQINKAGINLIGVVLNKIKVKTSRYYYYHYYGKSYKDD
jgi:capsular exopolysaccharide synthesis family protein